MIHYRGGSWRDRVYGKELASNIIEEGVGVID